MTTEPVPSPPDLSAGMFCPNCGYDLRALTGAVCPEYGLAIDLDKFQQVQIPWEHRRAVGRVRAFWRTARMATFRIKDLARESGRSVSYPDAQRFRWIIVILVAVPWSAIAGWLVYWLGRAVEEGLTLYPVWTDPVPYAAVLWPWVAGMIWWPVAVLSVILCLIGWSGVHTYWCHPPSVPVERQNRAIALAYYACAPLMLLWLGVIPAGLLLAIVSIPQLGDAEVIDAFMLREISMASGFVLVLIAIGVPLLFLWNLAILLRRCTHCSRVWTLFAVLGTAVSWLGILVFGVYVVPWLIGMVVLIIGSFR